LDSDTLHLLYLHAYVTVPTPTSTRRKNTIKRASALPDIDGKENDEDDGGNVPPSTGGIPCIAGEFRSALDTLFGTLEETQAWYVFCIVRMILNSRIDWKGDL